MDNLDGESVQLTTRFATMAGVLNAPPNSRGVVLLVYQTDRASQERHQLLAARLVEGGLATLVIDLLTAAEAETSAFRADLDLLANRLIAATDWLAEQPATQGLPVGYWAVGSGAGAALVAAAERPAQVNAVVLGSGQPDSAGDALARVEAATLLIVGGADTPIIHHNQEALALLRCKKQLEIIPGVMHVFDGQDALDAAARLTLEWFKKYL